MKNKKGFTLVELLVVIAIIGILSTVAVVNLNSARDKATFAAAQAAVSQMSTGVILCLDYAVENGNTAAGWTADPLGGAVVCSAVTGSEWVGLPSTNWSYGDSTEFTHDSAAYTWEFCIGSTDTDIQDIVCDQDGCGGVANGTCASA